MNTAQAKPDQTCEGEADTTGKVVETLRERDKWLRLITASHKLGDGDCRLATRLAIHLNMKTGQCNPSYQQLADGTAQKITAIPKQLKRLEAAGFLRRTGSKGRHANNYDLVIPEAADGENKPGANQRQPARVATLDRDTLLDFPTTDRHRSTLDGKSSQPCMAIHTRNIEENNEKNNEKNNEGYKYLDFQFDEFWKQYPKRVGKGAAKKSFERVLKKRSATFEQLIAGVHRYAGERLEQDPRYTLHPSTWLNGEHWLDELQPRDVFRRDQQRPPSRIETAIAGMMAGLTEEDFHR